MPDVSMPPLSEAPPDLDKARIIVSVSGGKDSGATVLALRDAGHAVELVHFDTGWEHPATMYYVRHVLPAAFGQPITVLARLPPDLTERQLQVALEIEERLWEEQVAWCLAHGHPVPTEPLPSAMVRWICKKGMFASKRRRFCTQELKVFTARDFFSGLDEDAVNVVGIRREEGKVGAACGCTEKRRNPSCRLHTPAWEWMEYVDGYVWRPIVEWTMQDVVDIHQRHGLSPNPLYLQGADRVGCWPCLFARKAELRMLAEISPERVATMELLEARIAELARERYAEQGETPESLGYVEPAWFQAPRPDRTPGYRCTSCKTFVAGTKADPIKTCHCGAPMEWYIHRSGRPAPIAEVIAWSYTVDGKDDYEPYAPDPGDGGCLRWGFCDTGWRERQEAPAVFVEQRGEG